MSYCHQKGLVHKKLKLESILVSDDGKVKVLDWGFCPIFEGPNRSKSIYTYVFFQAPECVEGQGGSGAIDIWSLGALFFAILYGKYPFLGRTLKMIKEAILRAEVVYPDDVLNNVSESCLDFISSCLQREPAD